MRLDDSLLIIKPYHCATVRFGKKITISFENRSWKKEFKTEILSINDIERKVKELGFSSYRIKSSSSKWKKIYLCPWWQVNEFDKDWNEIYKSKGIK